MKVELLYFEDCPSWQTGLDNLRAALSASDIEAGIKLVRVEAPEAAIEQQFMGSPTIRVDGQDLFPVEGADYALGCRVYQTPEGMRGWPTVAMIRAAFEKTQAAKQS